MQFIGVFVAIVMVIAVIIAILYSVGVMLIGILLPAIVLILIGGGLALYFFEKNKTGSAVSVILATLLLGAIYYTSDASTHNLGKVLSCAMPDNFMVCPLSNQLKVEIRCRWEMRCKQVADHIYTISGKSQQELYEWALHTCSKRVGYPPFDAYLNCLDRAMNQDDYNRCQ